MISIEREGGKEGRREGGREGRREGEVKSGESYGRIWINKSKVKDGRWKGKDGKLGIYFDGAYVC